MIKLLYIDLFCGAGGTSTGVESARVNGEQCAKVIACVNHDANAIASHAANHPDVLHFAEDIRTLDLTQLVLHTMHMRAMHPFARLVLWASLECTNFSKAKGGQPRDADSRTLAENLFRYIEALNPEYIQIENVAEFMCWGDLDEQGKPISRDQGRLYLKWVNKVKSFGYDFDWRILNAADYGAYTSRKRFFGQFAIKGLPIVFPEATHAKCTTNNGSLFQDDIKPWKPVREVLDLNDEGESIFGRRKPLVEKTLVRIYAGLIKFVAGGKDEYLIRYNTVRAHDTVKSLDEPCGTLTTENRFAKAKVHFLSKQFSGAPTLTCKDRLGLVTSHYLANEYSGGGQISDIEQPCPSILTKPKQNVVSCYYLMNPQFSSAGGSIDRPCFTLIARMDKMPPYLVSTKEGLAIEIYDTDSPMTVKIKNFMAFYCIADIRMRMLRIPELKRIMGFPSDYTLIGTQCEQKKFIGNAVEVNMARVLCEALCNTANL